MTTNTTTVPTLTEEQIKSIKGVVNELLNSMVREQAEKDYRKEALSELEDKYNISKKMITQVVKTRYKDKFDETVDQFNDFSELYDLIAE